jgi:hypothetical protein
MKKSVTKQLINDNPDPRLAILQAIQNNLSSDAALQSIAYILLGTAIGNAPDLNQREKYADVDFTTGKDIDPENFAVGTRTVGYIEPRNIISDFDDVVGKISDAVRDIVTGGKVIAGTLRINLNYHASIKSMKEMQTPLRCILMWIEKRK